MLTVASPLTPARGRVGKNTIMEDGGQAPLQMATVLTSKVCGARPLCKMLRQGTIEGGGQSFYMVSGEHNRNKSKASTVPTRPCALSRNAGKFFPSQVVVREKETQQPVRLSGAFLRATLKGTTLPGFVSARPEDLAALNDGKGHITDLDPTPDPTRKPAKPSASTSTSGSSSSSKNAGSKASKKRPSSGVAREEGEREEASRKLKQPKLTARYVRCLE